VKNLLEETNGKVWGEDIIKQTIGNGNSRELNNNKSLE
jgi:hypothetical protein